MSDFLSIEFEKDRSQRERAEATAQMVRYQEKSGRFTHIAPLTDAEPAAILMITFKNETNSSAKIKRSAREVMKFLDFGRTN